MTKKQKIQLLINYLNNLIPNPKIELQYETDFQLLVAVILSAQTTDIQVNKATKELFKYIKVPSDVKKIGVENIKKMISSIGFYKNKANFVYNSGIILEEKYNSQIPKDLNEAIKLPGVGIKTAKVVLSNLYDLPFLAVDTHIHRVLNRLSIVKTKTPEQTDKQADKVFSDLDKKSLHHKLVLFGRYYCKSRSPECQNCGLKDICNFNE